MSAPFDPVKADGKALLIQGVTAVKAFVDAVLSDTSAAIPKLEGDTLVAATAYLESILPSGVAQLFGIILTAGEAAVAPMLTALGVKGQVFLAYVQASADAFLAKYSV